MRVLLPEGWAAELVLASVLASVLVLAAKEYSQ
jgi:hypothetical protein